MSDAKFDVANLPEYADLESNGLSRANNDVFLKYVSMFLKDLKEGNIENYPSFISEGINLITQGEEQ